MSRVASTRRKVWAHARGIVMSVRVYRKTLARSPRALRAKEFSSVELERAYYLDRIEASSNVAKCLYFRDAENRRSRPRQPRTAICAAGRGGALTGVPIAHKDIFCTAGVSTTCGSRMLDNFVSPYDATVVAKLKAAGVVMLGKATWTNSPWAPRTRPATTALWESLEYRLRPGGSSGGSAAAVAARLVPVATATDTGGSIRQPAALCGITGIKPTYGRVSRYGMIAFASSLDQGGSSRERGGRRIDAA